MLRWKANKSHREKQRTDEARRLTARWVGGAGRAAMTKWWEDSLTSFCREKQNTKKVNLDNEFKYLAGCHVCSVFFPSFPFPLWLFLMSFGFGNSNHKTYLLLCSVLCPDLISCTYICIIYSIKRNKTKYVDAGLHRCLKTRQSTIDIEKETGPAVQSFRAQPSQ